jgi:iron-sulfur cluster repair protein YtfE (RIC family)
MDLPAEYAQRTISSILTEHPRIGTILEQYQIDCASCGSSSCLLKNVIAQHTCDPQRAVRIAAEINEYLAGL